MFELVEGDYVIDRATPSSFNNKKNGFQMSETKFTYRFNVKFGERIRRKGKISSNWI